MFKIPKPLVLSHGGKDWREGRSFQIGIWDFMLSISYPWVRDSIKDICNKITEKNQNG
jgi:hypothetical protein